MSIEFGELRLSRALPAPPARVYAAFSDVAEKDAWFGDEGEQIREHTLEFRVGGEEHLSGVMPDGRPYRFDACVYDLIDGQRIVYGYDLHVSGRRISVSLATIELAETDAGTELTWSESGAFLDGLDAPEWRVMGTNGLLDRLGGAVAAHAPVE
jgi:uncharacterized protein YndB with AHSA1/START domain